MIAFVMRHPVATIFALGLHLGLGVLLTQNFPSIPTLVNLSDSGQASEQIELTPKPVLSEPMRTFAVDQQVVQQQIARIQAEEEAKRAEQLRLAEEAKQNQQRLAELKKQQETQARLTEEARREAEIARLKKEAEQKRAAEERKRVEEAKKLAQEAEQKRKQAEEQARKVAQEAEQKRLVEEKRLQELEALKKQAEQQAKLEQQKQQALQQEIEQKEADKRRLEAEALAARLQKEMQEQEARLQRLAAEEEAKRREAARQKELLSLRETYISSISAKVRENWRTPADISEQAQCELIITQTPSGQVSSVKTDNCNQFATEQFKKAAESAVLRAQPLPRPPVEELFERNIRFVFKP